MGRRSCKLEAVSVLLFQRFRRFWASIRTCFCSRSMSVRARLEKLVTARPGDRKELISRLLGVEELEKAWNGMKAII